MFLRLWNCLLTTGVLFFCAQLYSEPATPQPRQQAWAVLNGGLTHTKAPHRLEAVKALSLITGERTAVKLAVRALSDDNSDVRAAAAITLGQLHAVSAIHDLREALSDKEISVVLAASQSLYQLQDKSAYGVYYALLMGDKKASDGLIQAQLDRFKDPKKVMELGLREGISFVPYGGIGLEAYRASKSDGWQVRAAAARYLARDPDPMSGDALMQIALTDDHSEVRMAALDALAERGDATYIVRLQRNLTDSKSAIRYRSAATILHLSDVGRKGRGKARSEALKSE